MNRKVVLTVIVVVLCISTANSVSRDKRSYSWLPSFLGGGSKAPAADELVDEAAPAIIDNGLHSGDAQQLTIPDITKIINNGHLVGNQKHYPIWRVHKYQGIQMHPLPISLVAQQVPLPSSEPRLPPSSTNIETWLPPELEQMARAFGVTDFSRLPSLEETMDLLGTTTKEETIEVIKDFAKTEEGRQTIRQFVEGENAQDNSVAASENIETVEEDLENSKNVENTEKVKYVEETDENVETMKNVANAEYAKIMENLKNADELSPEATAYFTQYLLPQNRGPLISTLGTFGAAPVQTEEQSEAENPDAVETTTQPSLFGRITQWVNFLNPLTNRKEIPIPPSEGEVRESAAVPVNANDDSIQIPNLPGLPPLPSIPGAEQPIPELPAVELPNQYIRPNLPKGFGGPYVRVKLPLAGFNPTPQYEIEPKYLNYAQNQLAQKQPIPVIPLQYFVGRDGIQRPIYQGYQYIQQQPTTHVSQSHVISQPAVNQPASHVEIGQQVDFNKPIYSTSQITQLQVPPSSETPQNLEEPVRSPEQIQSTAHININQQVDFNKPIYSIPQIASLQVPSSETPIKFVHAGKSHTVSQQPLPNTEPQQQFRAGVHPSNIGSFPLAVAANYEVFRKAPQIQNSYGAPALPTAYKELPPQTYWVSPEASSVSIHQQWENQPAASEVVERRVKLNNGPEVEENVKEEPAKVEKIVEEKVEDVEEEGVEAEIGVQSNENNDKIALDANRNNDDGTEQNNSLDSSSSEEKDQLNQKEQEIVDIKDVSAVEQTETSVYRNLRPNLKVIKRPISSNVQRIPNYVATGQMFRADPKAGDNIIPLTMRQMDDRKDSNANENQE